MINHRCKNCTWWDNTHDYVNTIPVQLSKNNPGVCRKHKPGAIQIERYFYGVQPIMDAEEFCGEFREDKS
jgi:hypothetical protein